MARAAAGVEGRKDAAVIDATPDACEHIDAAMAQQDPVDIVHTREQVVCVGGRAVAIATPDRACYGPRVHLSAAYAAHGGLAVC
jgi:hypothetical protein